MRLGFKFFDDFEVLIYQRYINNKKFIFLGRRNYAGLETRF